MLLRRLLYAIHTSYRTTYTVNTWDIIQQHYGRKQWSIELPLIDIPKMKIKGPFYLQQDYVTHRPNIGWKETCGLQDTSYAYEQIKP